MRSPSHTSSPWASNTKHKDGRPQRNVLGIPGEAQSLPPVASATDFQESTDRSEDGCKLGLEHR